MEAVAIAHNARVDLWWGADVLVNGDFADGLVGWDVSQAPPVMSVTDKVLRLRSDLDVTLKAEQTLALAPGQRYILAVSARGDAAVRVAVPRFNGSVDALYDIRITDPDGDFRGFLFEIPVIRDDDTGPAVLTLSRAPGSRSSVEFTDAYVLAIPDPEDGTDPSVSPTISRDDTVLTTGTAVQQPFTHIPPNSKRWYTYSIDVGGDSLSMRNISATMEVTSAYTSHDGKWISMSGEEAEPPPPPTNVTATVVSQTQVVVDWSAPADSTSLYGYRVRRAEADVPVPPGDELFADLGQILYTGSASGTFVDDDPPQGGKFVFYQITSTNLFGGESDPAAAAPVAPDPLPTRPLAFTAVYDTTTQNTLTWQPPTVPGGATEYRIMYSTTAPTHEITEIPLTNPTFDTTAAGWTFENPGQTSEVVDGALHLDGSTATDPTWADAYQVIPANAAAVVGSHHAAQVRVNGKGVLGIGNELYENYVWVEFDTPDWITMHVHGNPITTAGAAGIIVLGALPEASFDNVACWLESPDGDLLATVPFGTNTYLHAKGPELADATTIFYSISAHTAEKDGLQASAVATFGAPTAPLSLAGTWDSATQNSLTWQPPASPNQMTEYVVKYDATDQPTWETGTELARVPFGTNTVTHTKAAGQESTTFYYTVFSYRSVDQERSGPAVTTVTRPRPAAVTGFSGVWTDMSTNALSWAQSANTNGGAVYEVRWSTTSQVWGPTKGTLLTTTADLTALSTTHAKDSAAQADSSLFYGIAVKTADGYYGPWASATVNRPASVVTSIVVTSNTATAATFQLRDQYGANMAERVAYTTSYGYFNEAAKSGSGNTSSSGAYTFSSSSKPWCCRMTCAGVSSPWAGGGASGHANLPAQAGSTITGPVRYDGVSFGYFTTGSSTPAGVSNITYVGLGNSLVVWLTSDVSGAGTPAAPPGGHWNYGRGKEFTGRPTGGKTVYIHKWNGTPVESGTIPSTTHRATLGSGQVWRFDEHTANFLCKVNADQSWPVLGTGSANADCYGAWWDISWAP